MRYVDRGHLSQDQCISLARQLSGPVSEWDHHKLAIVEALEANEGGAEARVGKPSGINAENKSFSLIRAVTFWKKRYRVD